MGWTGNGIANWEMGWGMGYLKSIPANGQSENRRTLLYSVQQPLFYDFTWDSGDLDCLDCFKCKHCIQSLMIRKIVLSTCGYIYGAKPDSLMSVHQNSWSPMSFVLGHELIWRTAVSALNRSLLGAVGAKSSFIWIIFWESLTNFTEVYFAFTDLTYSK